MRLGTDTRGFYIEFDQCRWSPGNLRQEFNRRALDIIDLGSNLILGFSSGVDSQAALLSFRDQGIPIQTAFLYLPGYNDTEYNNLRTLEAAWQFKSIVIDIDPMKRKDEIMAASEQLGIPPFQILHREFLRQLPADANFLQGPDGPLVTFIKDVAHFYEGANTYEMSRNRAFDTLNRTGLNLLFDKTSEIVVSSLTDDIMNYFITAHKLYTGGGVKNVDWWDVYIKPMYYGRYWADDLIYFPKIAGYENIDYIANGPKHKYREKYIVVPVDKITGDLKSGGARYYASK